ncbi:serine/threonine-protein kinase Chk2-like [Tiliqua scincoides]|uniref:serine/threonine-protein kinase Chk2-like n=1 Tax=Tiliqua scincoides TaxID=71010 RepID=UPI0034633850
MSQEGAGAATATATQGGSQSSSSGSGSSTLSSLDTLPAQDLPAIPEEPEPGPAPEPRPQPWGRLFSLAEGLPSCVCVKNEYWFGRDPSCDYTFGKVNFGETELYKQYSKRHFCILRVRVSSADSLFSSRSSLRGCEGRLLAEGSSARLCWWPCRRSQLAVLPGSRHAA